MTALALFRPHEIALALAGAAVAQLALVGLFLLPPPAPVEVEISDENVRPIAIAITPVALMKLGSQTPGKLPASWQRRPPPPKEQAAQPSTRADTDVAPRTPLEAGVARTDAAPVPSALAGPEAAGDASADSSASSNLGSATGAAHGTETDPLKGRAADLYRAQLASWFLAHFTIRGKVPFETLQKLRGEALVSITDERRVGGYSIIGLSGNPVFDAEVEATLARIRASGAELPPPPPLYPDMLGKTLPVGFRCTVRSQCE